MRVHILVSIVAAFILVFLPSFASNSFATENETEKKKVYKIIAADGSVTYSDKPVKGAVEVDVPLGSTYTPVTQPRQAPIPPSVKKPRKPKVIGYQGFNIQRPVDNETIRDNSGNVSISVVFTPALESSHEIQFLVDGQLSSSGTSQSITLNNLDRGTHQLTVRIVDGEGEIVISQSINFHLKRHFVRQQ